MPIITSLGPKAFETAPLTTNNLAFLNKNAHVPAPTKTHTASSSISITDSSEASRSSSSAASAESADRHIVTIVPSVAAQQNGVTPPTRRQVRLAPASATLSSSSASSFTSDSPPDDDDDEYTVATPLSSVSSNTSAEYAPPPSAASTACMGLSRSSTVLDNKTVVADDEGTVISDYQRPRVLPPLPAKSTLAAGPFSFHSIEVSPPPSRAPPSEISGTDDMPSLLRKKSGELVKSSLRLSSLKRSKSMPNAKSVRFATHLEDVKFFRKSEKPAAVSHEGSPVAEVLRSSRPVWDWDIDSSSDDDEDGSLSVTDSEDEGDSWELVENDCPAIGGSSALNFARLSSGREVILESVKLNAFKTSLIGFVFVRNLAFAKHIAVRLTTDGWKTFVEVDSANYISSNHIFKYSDTDSSYDKFSFIIKLDTLCNYNAQVSVNFCVKYDVDGQTFWDNNSGKDYHVSFKKVSRAARTAARAAARSAAASRVAANTPPPVETVARPHSSDLDDVGFRLKRNNNFNESFQTSEKFMFHPRNSRNYLMKKIQSESSLATLGHSRGESFPQSASSARKPRASLSAASLGRAPYFGGLGKPQGTKSSVASPELRSNGFESADDYYDYSQIVQNFCFYGTTGQNPSPTPSSGSKWSYKRHSEPMHELTTEMSSLCLG